MEEKCQVLVNNSRTTDHIYIFIEKKCFHIWLFSQYIHTVREIQILKCAIIIFYFGKISYTKFNDAFAAKKCRHFKYHSDVKFKV